jgi:CRP-like cAMP-binding protein
MHSPHLTPLVQKLRHLFPLTAEETRILESTCSRTQRLESQTDTVCEGDRPSNCNLLLEGIVCRYVILEDGRRQIMSFHTPGDIFDAHSFLLDEMDHSIRTLTPCTVALIPHTAMVEITERHPRIARAIWKDTLVDAAIFRQWIANIGRRSAYQRLAHLICEIFIKHDIVGLSDGLSIAWPFTQMDLGDAAGLSVVHVNRTLQELRAKGLIATTRDRLTIGDWDALVRAGAFNARYLQLAEAGPGIARPFGAKPH